MSDTDTTPAIDPKHLEFIEEYLRSWSAAAAYRKTHPNASRETAWTEGPKYLRKPAVQSILKDMLEEKQMSANEVLEQLTHIARQGNIRALALLAKAHGLLIDRVEAKVDQKISWKDFIANDGDPEADRE